MNKRWQTRKAGVRGGNRFTRTSLYKLLTDVAYLGKVRYKDEVHDGEHPAIVKADTFARVQALETVDYTPREQHRLRAAGLRPQAALSFSPGTDPPDSSIELQ